MIGLRQIWVEEGIAVPRSQQTAATRPDPALGSCREGGQDHADVWSRDRQAATGLPLALVKSLADP